MMKSAVIFSDRDTEEEKIKQTLSKNSVSLSWPEYRRLIKEAYHEGREDALKEKEEEEEKKTSQKKGEGKIEKEGREEAIKEHAKEQEANRQRFETISERQDIELMRCQSVFPFTIFTDTLIIDTTKISISKKELFATEYITTIPLKDLSDINVQTYLFLGALTIKYMPQSASPGMNEPVTVKIPNLTRGDALKAKNILKGALVAKAEEIDIAKLSPDEIEKVLHKFGETNGVI